MLPIRRDLKFKVDKTKISSWHPEGAGVADYYNAFSVFLPVGERFFINSVRLFREAAIKADPQLADEITAFIGQEAMHGREHEEYNEALTAAGLPADRYEALVAELLEQVKKRTPASWQLGATIALEHYTGVMADLLLSQPKMIEGADARYAALWTWHALEETEHKGVCYDVYRAAVGEDSNPQAYAVRAGTMVLATAVFWPIMYAVYFSMLRAEGKLTLRNLWRGARWQFGAPGFVRRQVLPLLDYFRPGFHPWDHDNRHHLARVAELEHEYAVAA